jgi:hypothetical protein
LLLFLLCRPRPVQRCGRRNRANDWSQAIPRRLPTQGHGGRISSRRGADGSEVEAIVECREVLPRYANGRTTAHTSADDQRDVNADDEDRGVRILRERPARRTETLHDGRRTSQDDCQEGIGSRLVRSIEEQTKSVCSRV